VAEKLLNRPNVISGFKQVSRKGVAERVAGGVFGDPRGANGFPDGFLEAAFVCMMAPDHARRTRIGGEAVGGEDVLPGPFAVGIGVFAVEGEGQVDGAVAFCQVALVQLSDHRQVGLQGFAELVGQHSHAVFHAFAVPDEDLALAEVQVFDAQAEAFHQPEAAAVEEAGHQQIVAGQLAKNGMHFVFGEDDRQTLGLFSADDVERLVYADLQDFAVEEEKGAEGLGLGGGGDLFLDGQMGQKGGNFGRAHGFGVTLVV